MTTPTGTSDWHTREPHQVLAHLGSRPAGLTHEEAQRRLAAHGPNELRAAEAVAPWRLLASQFKNVLIVILLLATALSAFLGHGIEAMELARAHKPDLILMDIQLPEVSGLEVTRWLKADEELKSIPVIAITAFAMKGDEERIREGGCEAYMSKPISVAKFIATVKTYLEADRASP